MTIGAESVFESYENAGVSSMADNPNPHRLIVRSRTDRWLFIWRLGRDLNAKLKRNEPIAISYPDSKYRVVISDGRYVA